MLPSGGAGIAPYEIVVHETLPTDAVIERAADAYLAGFSGPPYFETEADRFGFIDRVRRYALRDGFRLAIASIDDSPVGVGLAVIGRPGDWWRDQVASQLTETEVRTWLGEGALELVNLAVRPERRGLGVGAALHDALLARPPVPTAVLTADVAATPARHLYASRGWSVLREPFAIAGGEPVVLLVRRLAQAPA
jgi:ribosomal protein S18 acetylase RimI-like enzyme